MNNNRFRVVKISGKDVVTVLDTFDSREVAELWMDGFIRGGGITRKGKSEKEPTCEVWEMSV